MLPPAVRELCDCACAVLDILKLLLRGVWTGRRTCWSVCGRKSGTVRCFFSLPNQRTFKSWRVCLLTGRRSTAGGQRSRACDNARDAAGGPPLDVETRPCFKLIEIWKKQKFFSHHFYFWAVRIYCRFFFLQGPQTEIRDRGLDQTLPQTLLFFSLIGKTA